MVEDHKGEEKMDKKKSVVSFGKGWGVIIFCMAAYFFYGGMNTDGLNVTVPLISANVGVEQGVLFTYQSYACVIGVVIHILLGQLVNKIGPKKNIAVGLIIGGIAYYCQANSTSVAGFIISSACVYGFMMNAAFMSGGILVANYFPKRKGVVMGYTTMGLNINSACFVAILTVFVSMFGGINKGVLPIVVATIVLGILALIFVKDTPKEIGMFPDNVSEEEYLKDYENTDQIQDDGGWTTGKLLRTPMIYGVAVATGIYNIATGCLVSNMVARNIEMGMSQAAAVGIMTAVALIGIFGSWIVGVFDEKWGTKKAMVVFGIFYCVAGVLNWFASISGSMIPLYISIFMIGVGIGGSANFTTSLAASVFGRHGFDKVNSVLFPIQALVTALNFLVSGVVRIVTNNSLMWIFFAGGMIALIGVPVVLLFIKDEYKYNRDVKGNITI